MNTLYTSKQRRNANAPARLWSLTLVLSLFSLMAWATGPKGLNLDVQLTVFDLTCEGTGGAITSTVSGGVPPYTYLWSNNATTPGIADLDPGSYSVTVTDDVGSTATATATVELENTLELFMGSSYETCVGSSDGNVSVNVSGGTGFYTYLWNTGDDFVVVYDLSAGIYTVTVTDTVSNCSAVGTVELEISPEGIWVMTSSTDVTCNGFNDGTGYVGIMTGVPPFTVVWSDNQTGTSPTGLGAGTYYVTVTDVNGCSALDSILVNEPPAIVSSFTVQNEDCDQDNGAIDVTVSGGVPGYTYAWSNSAVTEDLTGLSSGSYTLTVTDASGCTHVVGPIDVLDDCPPPPCTADAGTLTLDPTDLCLDNGSVIVTATPNGNAVVPTGFEVVYVLTSGTDLVIVDVNTTAPSFNITTAGDYTMHTLVYDPNTLDLNDIIIGTTTGGDVNSLLIQGGGTICASLDVPGAPFTVIENCCINPIIASVVVIEATCNNSDGSATITMVGNNSDFSYTWSPDIGTPNSVGNARTQLPAGVYSVTISNPLPGCPEIVEVFTIGNSDSPLVTIVSTTPATCNETNGTAVMSEVGFEYTWCNGETGYNPTMLPAGSCIVTITDPVTNCTDFMEVIIDTFNPLEVNPVVNNQPDCGVANGSVTLEVSNGSTDYGYLWEDGVTDATRDDLSSGIYSVTVTDNGPTGCTQTAIFVLTDDVPGATITVEEPISVSCVGFEDATVNFTIDYDPAFSQPATVLIQDADGNVYTNGSLAPGEYCIVVNDANGCVAAAACFEVEEPEQIDVDIAIDNTCDTGPAIRIVEVLGGNGGYTYDWADLPGNDNVQDRIDIEEGSYDVTVTDIQGCSAAANNLVVIDTCECPPIILSSVVVVEASCGNSDGKATINVVGDPNAYTYTWPNNESAYWIAENLPAGTYSVTITSVEDPHCDLIEEFSVGNVDGPEVDFTTSASVCGVDDGEVTFSNPDYDYTWNDVGNLGTNVRTGMSAGTYFVTVTDPNDPDCFDVLTIVIEEESPLTIDFNIVSLPDCNSNNGVVTINVSGGSNNYTYSWGSSDTQSDLSSGAYEVVVTDAVTGCTGSIDFVLADDVPGVSLIFDAEASISCPGATDGEVQYTLQEEVGFQGPPVITVVDADGNVYDEDNLGAGSYCLIIEDANGCVAGGDCFEVRDPGQIDVDVAVFDENCDELGSVTLVDVSGGTPDYTYQWDGATSTDSLLMNLEAGAYGFTVTDANDCVVSETVTVDEDPNTLNLTTNADTVICGEAPITLIATSDNATDYQWTNSNGDDVGNTATIMVTPAATETYYVVASNAGCEMMDSVQVMVASVDVEVTPQIFLCEGEETQISVVNLDNNDILTYDWTPDDFIIGDENTGTPIIMIDEAGDTSIIVDIVNQFGCTFTDTIEITVIDSTDVGITTNAQCDGYTVDFTVTGGNAPFYTWYFGDPTNPGAISNDPTPSYTYPGPGTYDVLLVLPEGVECFEIDSIEIEVTVVDTPLFDLGIEVEKLECGDSLVLEFTDVSTNATGNIVSWDWTIGGETYEGQIDTVVIYQSQELDVQLIVETEDGCLDTLNTSVPAELVEVELPEVVEACAGVPTLLDTTTMTSYVYEWTPADSLDSGTIPNPTATSTVDIPFEVTISDSMGMCSITRSVLFDVSDGLNLQIEGDLTPCTDDAEPLTAISLGSGVTYTWATDPDFINVVSNEPIYEAEPGTPDAPNEYYVLATDASGCTEMMNVSLTNLGLNIDITVSDTALCPGDTISLIPNFSQVPSGYPFEQLTYEWNGDGIITDINGEDILAVPETGGIYTLTITNNLAQCSSSSSSGLVNVSDLSFFEAFADPDTIFLSETSQLSLNREEEGMTYFWTPEESLDDNTITNPVAEPEETTLYTVEIEDDNGCVTERSVTVTVVTNPCDEPFVFFPNAFSPNGDGANDVLYLRGVNVTEVYFAIYNRWGEKVYESFSKDDGWDGTFRGKELPPDVYGFYLRVRCADNEEFYKQGNVTLFRQVNKV